MRNKHTRDQARFDNLTMSPARKSVEFCDMQQSQAEGIDNINVTRKLVQFATCNKRQRNFWRDSLSLDNSQRDKADNLNVTRKLVHFVTCNKF